MYILIITGANRKYINPYRYFSYRCNKNVGSTIKILGLTMNTNTTKIMREIYEGPQKYITLNKIVIGTVDEYNNLSQSIRIDKGMQYADINRRIKVNRGKYSTKKQTIHIEDVDKSDGAVDYPSAHIKNR